MGRITAKIAAALPLELGQLIKSGIQGVTPVTEAVKQAVVGGETFSGVKVARGFHIRVV